MRKFWKFGSKSVCVCGGVVCNLFQFPERFFQPQPLLEMEAP